MQIKIESCKIIIDYEVTTNQVVMGFYVFDKEKTEHRLIVNVTKGFEPLLQGLKYLETKINGEIPS